jgi:hypothetical protein
VKEVRNLTEAIFFLQTILEKIQNSKYLLGLYIKNPHRQGQNPSYVYNPVKIV